MCVQGAGINLLSQGSIHFSIEGQRGRAVVLEHGSVATYPIDKHTYNRLPQSNLPRSLEDTIRELLKQNFLPSIQSRRLIWISPSERISGLLSYAKEQTKARQCSQAVNSLLEAYRLVMFVEDKFAEVNFLEKLDKKWLKELLEQTNHYQLKDLIEKKEKVRAFFEKTLKELMNRPAIKEKLSCFICFSLGDSEVDEWLEQTFVPDLQQAGIRPIFCRKDLNIGMSIDKFQRQVRTADFVVLICTRDLKQKCKDRKKDPFGAAEEVRLAVEKYKNAAPEVPTIFPVFLRGDHKTACPKEFKGILGTNFTLFEQSSQTQFFSYYEHAFELFGGMLGIERSITRKIKDSFLTNLKNHLNEKQSLSIAELIKKLRKQKMSEQAKQN